MGGCLTLIISLVVGWLFVSAIIGIACAILYAIIGIAMLGAIALPWWVFLLLGLSIGLIIKIAKRI